MGKATFFARLGSSVARPGEAAPPDAWAVHLCAEPWSLAAVWKADQAEAAPVERLSEGASTRWLATQKTRAFLEVPPCRIPDGLLSAVRDAFRESSCQPLAEWSEDGLEMLEAGRPPRPKGPKRAKSSKRRINVWI